MAGYTEVPNNNKKHPDFRTTIEKLTKNGPDALLYSTVHPFYQFNFGDFINVYFEPNRYVTIPENYLRYQTTIENFQVRDSDIFVMGHPRCGINFVAEIVWCLANNCNLDLAKSEYLHNRCPALEDSIIPRPIARLFNKYVRRNSFEYSNQVSDPRCIRTHLPISLLPESLKKGPKIIYIIRNPKDVCVSWYFMSSMSYGFRGTLDEFITLFTNNYRNGPFWNSVLDGWSHRLNPNILFLTYEELSRDLRSSLLRIAGFLKKDLSGVQMKKLLKHLSFEEMKKNVYANNRVLVDQIPYWLRSSLHGNPVRFGKVGNYLEYLNEEQILLLDQWTKNAIVNTDFDLKIFDNKVF